MQEIWRKTFELLRRYPDLWWPALLANICSFGLKNLQKVIHFQLVQWMMTGKRSVLGGPPVLVEPAPSLAKLAVMNGVIDVSLNYLSILMFCMALAVVTSKVRCLLMQQNDPCEIALPVERFRSTLRFSLVSTICILCTGAVTLTIPMFVFSRSLNRFYAAQQSLYAPIMSLPFYLVLGFVLSPFALAFMKQKRVADIEPLQRKEGRVASLLAALVLPAFIIVLNEMPIPDLPTYAMRLMQDAIISLLGTLPYVALFVALAVIAFGSDRATEILPADILIPGE